MPVFTVRHTTTYRYARPVGFGEHHVMLRPLESEDQRLLAFNLTVTPQPESLNWTQDGFGNWTGTARFRGRARALCFAATSVVDQTPWKPDAPLGRQGGLGHAVSDDAAAPYLRRADPDAAVAAWAKRFLAGPHANGGLPTLIAITRAIQARFAYLRREAKGIQSPAETLRLGTGSCRDFAVLMIDAARALGIPARFVSGYLHVPSRAGSEFKGGGSTHAWVHAHLSGIGWTDFDPTNGTLGNHGLIRIATAPDPVQVLPLCGTFIGFPADPLGMAISVTVDSGDAGRREPRRELVG